MKKTIPPKQYQQGWTEFYMLKFNLTPDVLIPRPETELLVDEVLRICRDCRVANASRKDVIASEEWRSTPKIIDLGTGSGCIAISIAKNLAIAKIIATDISKKALLVAEGNARMHKVLDQIIFLEADLLPDLKVSPDIIVTNLPYIPSARLKLIDPMVTEFEPKIALDGGYDGFEIYRKLFTQLNEYKIYPKYLIGEIDYSFSDIIESEVPKFFPNSEFEIKKDLAKKQRILMIKF